MVLTQAEFDQMMEEKRSKHIPSITAATSQALVKDLIAAPAGPAKEWKPDPICRNCGQRKSIHTITDEESDGTGKFLLCFCNRGDQHFETLEPPTPDPRLQIPMITQDTLDDKLVIERKSSSKQAQLITAICLAKLVDELKVENASLRCLKAEIVDKYVDTRKRENALDKENYELRQSRDLAIDRYTDLNRKHNETMNDYGEDIKSMEELRTITAREEYQRGRRSMEKWIILAWGAGLICGAVVLATVFASFNT